MSNMILDLSPWITVARTMQNWPAVLEKHIATAMKFSIAGLQSDAPIYAPYLSGDLHDSIQPYYFSSYKAMVYSDLPYSWRREEGFSGMTDSLGRYYANDPGAHYMRKSLSRNKPNIRAAFNSEVNAAVEEITGVGNATGMMGWII